MALRHAGRWAFENLGSLPLIGPVLRRYASHYERAGRSGKTSALTSSWESWSIKFSAEYYETKEKEKAAATMHYPRPAE
jgi:hypothetical protein